MTTIIDELVVAIALDPSGVSAGQKKVIDDFAALKAAAQSSVGTIGSDTKKSLQGYLEAIHGELKDVNLGLVNLGAQSRRSGQAVRAGGMAGAEGITALATASLAAYASLKSVQDILKGIGSATGGAAQTARMAGLINIPVQQLSAFEQYAFAAGNVPRETTEQALNAFQQARTEFQMTGQGPMADIATWMGRFGVNYDPKAPVLSQVSQIFDVMSQHGGPEAELLAGKVGLAPLVNVGRLGGGAMQRGIAEHMPTALTDDQARNLTALQHAINDVTSAWDHLYDTVISDNPQWTEWLKTFHDWEIWLSNTPEGLHAVEAAAGAVLVAIGVTMAAAVNKLVTSVMAANAAIINTPLGRFLLLGYMAEQGAENMINKGPGSGQPDPYGLTEGWNKWLDPVYLIRRLTGRAHPPAPSSTSPPAEPTAPVEPLKRTWQSYIPGTVDWFKWTGRSLGITGGGAPPTSAPSTPPGPQGATTGVNQTAAVTAGILATENSQAGNQISPAGATGPMQIMPDTWTQYARPGEDINNRTDNMTVGSRIVADLMQKYHDPRQVAYAYNHGHPGTPEQLNTSGYVQKFDQNYKPPAVTGAQAPGTPAASGTSVSGTVDHMVAMAGIRGPDVRNFLRNPQGVIARDPDLGKWCAEYVNAYLQHIGVPGPAGNKLWAPDFANWGMQVNPGDVHKGDVLLNKDRAHVGVATGNTRMNNGVLELEETSSNSLGPNGELLNIPGQRWRSDVEVRRSAELAAAQRNDLNMIRTGNATRGAGAAANDDHSVDNNVNIGQMNVHTQAQDAQEVMRVMSRSIRSELVLHANTGTE